MSQMHPSLASRYVPPLTGIRALAALLVLGMHTGQNVPSDLPEVLPFLTRGYLGVDFFFVLSGFIITHVYLGSLAQRSRRGVQVFLWHRFIRLYPVHVTVLAALVILISIVHLTHIGLNYPQEWSFADLPWQLTLLHAWGVTAKPGWNAPSWSISAEWFAYLCFPLLAPALALVHDRVSALLLATAALAGTALVFTIADWSLNTWVGAPALVRVLGEFVCGAALCRVVALSNSPSGLAPDLLGTAAFLFFLVAASIGMPDFGLVALLALTILGAGMARGPLAGILGSRPFVWLGEISYSLYMVHFPVLLVARRLWERVGIADWGATARAVAFLITVVVITGLAALLFYAVERPARMRLRDWMGKLVPA